MKKKKKISSVAEIPEWLRNREYKKKLSEIDWYRAVRKRQTIASLIDMRKTSGVSFDQSNEVARESLLSIIKSDARPDSLIYYVAQTDRPVSDLTAGESLYLCAAHEDFHLHAYSEKISSLMSLWRKACLEDLEGPTPLFGEYEHRLAQFFDDLEDSPFSEKLDQPIESFLPNIGNPWLSYGRPLNGYPITVDTQFDDDTILEQFKRWLSARRTQDGERARRPFCQNDFDDWEYFKIRQIFDLESWATVMGSKILDRVIVQHLWPNADDDISPIDILRTTARKKTREIFTFNVVVRFYGQMVLKHGENFLTV